MLIQTKSLGEVEINDNEILTVIDGIIGFPKYTKYALIMKDNEAPFAWLQSIEESGLAFVVIDPNLFKYKYKLKVSDEFIKKIKSEGLENVVSYAIVVIPESNTSNMTANLQGPVIINTETKLATQAISDIDKYGIRHNIMQELQEKKLKEQEQK